MSGRSAHKRLQKVIGTLKDSTVVNLARIDGAFKELDVAIIQATSQVERSANEKRMRAIFAAISPTRPRADVAYCIHALARRLAMTNSWMVALKALIVIHRALREVQPTFRYEIINYSRARAHLLNMSHLKDDSSINALDYSSWIRTYALFLEEKLECYRVLGYDGSTEIPRTDDLEGFMLLEKLPALQQILFRVLGCQPQGAATHNFLIQSALSMVVSEGIKIYNGISAGTICLIDKFFDMSRSDSIKVLDICRRTVSQAERALEFLEACKSLDVGVGEDFIKFELSPASLEALEDYVRGADLQRFTDAGRSTWMTPTSNVLPAQSSQWSQPQVDELLFLTEELDLENYKIGELNYVWEDNYDNDKGELNNDNNLATNPEEQED